MSFASPLFLLGLLAVAIPIAVHLFNFRRYKKVYFSNVEFLEEVRSETRRQSNLRRLLVLAARILAIVFLALAFAQPVIPNRDNPLRSGASDVSIYIDNSFSMEAAAADGTQLEYAKTKAREVVGAFSQTDRFQLITNDVEGHQFHWLSKDELLSAIDEVEVSSATRSLSAIATRQYDFLHSGSGENKYAFLISDFQTSVADFDAFPPDSTVRTSLIPLEASAVSNVYIDSLALDAPVFTLGNAVVAEVHLRNDGDENLEKVPVSLYINDRQRALASVDLPARSAASVDLHFVIDGRGILDGRVETTDYPITFDDRYYFSVNVRDRVRLLLVEGSRPNEFLQRLFAFDSTVELTVVSMQQFDYATIEDHDAVLLDELPSFSSGLAQSLLAFVQEGGTLIVVPGEHPDLASYNEALRQFNAPRLSSWSPARVSATEVDYSNRLYANVFSSVPENVELPTVTGYHTLSADGTSVREPVITLANGDAYVLSTTCGDGRVYLITTPLRDEHSDFMRQSLFVPTCYNMALFSVRPTPPAVMLDNLLPVALSGHYGSDLGLVRLQGADFEEIPDIRRAGGQFSYIPHSTMAQAGNYRLVQEGNAVEGISFNYSRRESQLDFLGRAALEQIVKDYGLTGCTVVRNVGKPLDSYLRSQYEGRQLWRWCILLALLMLAAEIVLLKWPAKR